MLRRHWLISACGASTGTLGGCMTGPPLRVGTHPWIGHEPLMLAHDFRWLPPTVQLQFGRSARDSLGGLQAGELDAATLTLDETLSARAAGVPLTAVLVLDSSSGADMLLARPGVDALPALRGRRIAVERSAVGELMLVKALEAAGLAESDLTPLAMPLDDQPVAARNDRIDAAITYEPTASRLLRLGWRRLFDSRAIPYTIFDVLAVRRDRLGPRRSAVEAAVAGHFLGLAHLRMNRPDATYRIASRNDMQPAEVMQALSGVTLPDLSHNKRLLEPSAAMRAAADALARLMVARQLLPRPDDGEGLFEPGCLPSKEPTT